MGSDAARANIAGLNDEGAHSLLTALFDSTELMCGIFELEAADYRYLLANVATARFYDRSPEEMRGLRGADLGLSASQIQRRMEDLRTCWITKQTLKSEYRFTLGQRSGWYLGTFSALPGEAPRVSFVLIDITARKTAELNAERERERLQVALDATGLGLWEYDLGSDTVSWDERTRALFGVSADQAIDLSLYRSRLHPDEAEELARVYEAALGGADDGAYSRVHRTTDTQGRTRWVRGSGQVLFDGKGRPKRVLGTTLDVTEEVEARERQALLMAELNHRVKNNLATVQALALQTARRAADLPTFVNDFEGRLMALARAHDVLMQSAWSGAELRALLAEELSTLSDKVTLEGPRVELTAGAALALGLIVHELATNALKHGALRSPAGAITLAWRVSEGGQVSLVWRERGGAPVAAPTRRGFGSQLIARLVEGDLKGALVYEFSAEGLSCQLTFEAAPGGDLARGAE